MKKERTGNNKLANPRTNLFFPKTKDVLTEVVALVLEAGAAEFEMEYKDGAERVFACSGAMGLGIAAFRADEGRELRHQLHMLKRKRGKAIHAGLEYWLRVQVFDSFGEEAFHVTITPAASGRSIK